MWRRLKNLRLSALRDSPQLFLATYDDEFTFSSAHWRAEFDRGTWHACRVSGNWVSLLGVTWEESAPHEERFLEYMWVSPFFRRCGIAQEMLTVVLGRLKSSGVRTVNLWVLDGNDAALMLYERIGFRRTWDKQDIKSRPGRSEERMELALGNWQPRRRVR